MRLTGRVILACCLLAVSCVSDDEANDEGDDRSPPDAGADASTGGSRSTPVDAGMDASAMDAGPIDAQTRAEDASDGPCVTELECTDDCTYEARELDPEADCLGESAYVYEGTCGAYRYRATGDGFVSSASYYRLDTGELVATTGGSDEGGLCGSRDVFDTIAGDVAVVDACEIPWFSPENLCCFTERAEYISFCELGDAGP